MGRTRLAGPSLTRPPVARGRSFAAIDAVGGTDARNLEPRLVTGTNAVRSALFVPALIVFLDSLGVTFSAVWGLLALAASPFPSA